MLTWSTSDLAEALHTDRHKIDYLRAVGLLHGIKISKGYIYPQSEVDRFLNDMMDKDLSNKDAIDEVRIEMERILKNGN